MTDLKDLHIQKYRFERKFYLPRFTTGETEFYIKMHPKMFHTLYAPRRVNSLYFDTYEFKNYFDNVNGLGDRRKLRIRWYGQDLKSAKNPKFEIKIKKGLLGIKDIINLKDFHLDKDLKNLENYFEESKGYDFLVKSHTPVLFVTYKRNYLISADKKFRVTVDSDLDFYKVTDKIDWRIKHTQPGVIVELKYASEDDIDARDISSMFPFRMTKFSKYVAGVQAYYAD